MRAICCILSAIVICFNLLATPSWESPALHNGQLRLDGQLYKRMGLGMLSGSPEFKFPIYLEHNISKYPFGELEYFSQWTVPQLTSYVAPMNGGIFWLSPGGEEYFFKWNSKNYPILGYRPTRIKTPYIAYKGNAKQEPDRIYIISKDRFVYAYDKGELKSLEAPSGRKLYFKTKGIRITGIEQRADTAVYNLLSAKYDELNRLVSLKIGPISHKFAYEGDSEMLASWKPFNIPEREVKFRYRDGLLSSITYPNTDRENFVWTTSLKDFEAGGRHYLDNTKFKPVLMSDSENMYTFGQEKAGIVMQKANLLGNADKTIFNPRTNRLTTIDKGGVSNSVQWGRGFQNEATNKLSEVISPKGEAVVKLDYDEEGRISQMVKRGEKPVKYEYDDQDRIVSITNGDYPPTKYEYDARGDMVFHENHIGQTIENKYDKFGNFTEKKTQEQTISISYDKFDRVVGRKYAKNQITDIAYDDYGRIASINSAGTKLEFKYDALGRQIRKSLTYPDGSQSVSVMEYTSTVKRKKILNAYRNADKKEETRSVAVYKYDALDRPVEAKIDGVGKIRYLYDKKSQMLACKIFPNGNKSTYTYDDNFRLKTIQTFDAKNKLLGGVEYVWDSDGTLKGKNIWE